MAPSHGTDMALREARPRRIELHKYGGYNYSQAFPTPLGKYLQKAEDQKLMLEQLERHVARNLRPHETSQAKAALAHKQEPEILTQAPSIN